MGSKVAIITSGGQGLALWNMGTALLRRIREGSRRQGTSMPAKRMRNLRPNHLLILGVISVTLVASCSPQVIHYEQADSKCGNVLHVEADPQQGFHWPYLLYVPEECSELPQKAPILVAPNNSGTTSDDMAFHQEEAEDSISSMALWFRQHDLQSIILVPVFPRFSQISNMGGWRYYTQALDRDALLIRPEENIALTVRWQGELLTDDHYMAYHLDDVFVAQDNLVYRCAAANFNPVDPITGVSEFEAAFLFDPSIDIHRPFNFIEYPYGDGTFLFQNTYLNEQNEVVNNVCVQSSGIELVDIAFRTDDDFPQLWDNAGKEYRIFDKQPLERLDLQLVAMIDDARERLEADLHIEAQEEVSVFGFSASGMFADRFCYLQPERVKAAAIGSPGGLPMVPATHWKGQPLRYPVGLFDYEEVTGRPFDTEAFEAIHRLVFLGDQDVNDSVPYPDSFEEEDKDLIFALFGTTPVERFPVIEGIFEEQNLNNTVFSLYPGVEHEITPEIREDITEFLSKMGH